MLQRMLTTSRLALACIMLLIGLAPLTKGEATKVGFEALQARIEHIAAAHEQNIGVYVETPDGTVAVNETIVMSSASTIKVPILAEAIRQAEQGRLIWQAAVIVNESDVVTGSGVIKDMQVPLTTTVKELAELMIVVSDNTATNMLMERVGFDEVNWACARMGCLDTVLQNSIYTSMPQDRGPRNYTTARDMAVIVKAVNEGGFLTAAGRDEFLRIMRDANKARLAEHWDASRHGDIVIGRKGGSTATPRVLHDVAVFTRGDDAVYAAVLTRDVEPAVATPAIAEIGRAIMDYMLETH